MIASKIRSVGRSAAVRARPTLIRRMGGLPITSPPATSSPLDTLDTAFSIPRCASADAACAIGMLRRRHFSTASTDAVEVTKTDSSSTSGGSSSGRTPIGNAAGAGKTGQLEPLSFWIFTKNELNPAVYCAFCGLSIGVWPETSYHVVGVVCYPKGMSSVVSRIFHGDLYHLQTSSTTHLLPLNQCCNITTCKIDTHKYLKYIRHKKSIFFKWPAQPPLPILTSFLQKYASTVPEQYCSHRSVALFAIDTCNINLPSHPHLVSTHYFCHVSLIFLLIDWIPQIQAHLMKFWCQKSKFLTTTQLMELRL